MKKGLSKLLLLENMNFPILFKAADKPADTFGGESLEDFEKNLENILSGESNFSGEDPKNQI